MDESKNDDDILSTIKSMFYKWYYCKVFDSTGRAGIAERNSLIEYCKQHKDEFKLFATSELFNPDDCCIEVANLCNDIFVDAYVLNSNGEKIKIQFIDLTESYLFNICNFWTNYFKGTVNVDYYKHYKQYKEYLRNNYIEWNPNKEDDPNPTYYEFLRKNNIVD